MRATSCLLLSLLLSTSSAASAASPAIVISDQVNARARPGTSGEVLTHLKRGELVHVLGEVTDSEAKTGEPKRWAKIEMPAFVPVWVSSDLVDPTSMTVKADGVNLRAGPGKTFSSVGAVPRGTKLSEISSEGGWIQVEAPAGTYAFVATKLLSNDAPPDRLVGKPVAPARSDPKWISVPEAAPEPVPPVVLAVPPDAVPAESIPEAPVPNNVDVASATALTKSSAVDRTATTEAAAPPPPQESELAPAAAAPAAPPAPATDEKTSPVTPTRRVVTRLGVIRHSWNVRSPSHYSLRSLNRGEGELDLLWSTDPKLDLSTYVGRKALIRGEEYIDTDWPRTPLLKIEKITTY